MSSFNENIEKWAFDYLVTLTDEQLDQFVSRVKVRRLNLNNFHRIQVPEETR